MLTQKQWKTQHLAEHMLSLATSIAAEAGRQSALRQLAAKDHAVIAEETRNIAGQMIQALENHIFSGFQSSEFNALMLEMSRRTAFLALNTALVSCKVRELKPLAVFADELRTFSLDLGELYGNGYQYADIPAASPRSRIIPGVFDIFYATSGQYTWSENAQFVQEVMNYCPEFIQNNRLVIQNAHRDMDMPFIVLGDVPSNPGVVIISDAIDPKKMYAVLADFGLHTLHSLVSSHVGVSKPCTTGIPVRECWAASDGSDIIFPDWEKLVSVDR